MRHSFRIKSFFCLFFGFFGVTAFVAVTVALVKIEFQIGAAVGAFYAFVAKHILVKINGIVTGGTFYLVKLAVILFILFLVINDIFNK